MRENPVHKQHTKQNSLWWSHIKPTCICVHNKFNIYYLQWKYILHIYYHTIHLTPHYTSDTTRHIRHHTTHLTPHYTSDTTHLTPHYAFDTTHLTPHYTSGAKQQTHYVIHVILSQFHVYNILLNCQLLQSQIHTVCLHSCLTLMSQKLNGAWCLN